MERARVGSGLLCRGAFDRRGFTLIELVVATVIIGILAAIAVPMYMNSLEINKANAAASTVNMIANANRMYSLDHYGAYAYGPVGSGGGPCGTTTACAATPSGSGCDLVWCKYMADQSWGSKPYSYQACNPGSTCGASGLSGLTAYTISNTGPNVGTWGYSVLPAGQVSSLNGAPAPNF